MFDWKTDITNVMLQVRMGIAFLLHHMRHMGFFFVNLETFNEVMWHQKKKVAWTMVNAIWDFLIEDKLDIDIGAASTAKIHVAKIRIFLKEKLEYRHWFLFIFWDLRVVRVLFLLVVLAENSCQISKRNHIWKGLYEFNSRIIVSVSTDAC